MSNTSEASFLTVRDTLRSVETHLELYRHSLKVEWQSKLEELKLDLTTVIRCLETFAEAKNVTPVQSRDLRTLISQIKFGITKVENFVA